MKIVAVVVTYNRKEMLRKCLDCLKQQTQQPLDTVVVDNASTDGTRSMLKDWADDKHCFYLNTGENLGGAGGFQYGIKYVAGKDYDAVWVMDDDCMPQSDALEKLVVAGEKLDGNYGFLCSKVLWTDGYVCQMNIQKVGITQKVTDFSSEEVKVISGTFVSMLIPLKVVREVGLPFKEFFIWCDDIEYSRRISRCYPCYLINSSIVIHETKTNIGSNIALDDYEHLDRYRYAYRNEVLYFRREGFKGIMYASARILTHAIRVLTKSKDHKMERLQIIVVSTFRGFKFNPKIEYARF